MFTCWPGVTMRRSSCSPSRLILTSVCAARSPKFWLGLLSTTTTATEESGSRSSRVSDGLPSASTSSASAPARMSAPRLRETSISAAMAAAIAAAAHTYSIGMSGEKLIPKFTPVLLIAEPLEQRRHVDLVGLVVAGQRVHYDVDAGAKREFALARLAPHQWQRRLALGPCRPSASQVVRRDEDRGHAV